MNLLIRSCNYNSVNLSFSASKLAFQNLYKCPARSLSNVYFHCNNTSKKFNKIVFKRNISISNVILDTKIVKTPTFAESVSEGDIRWSKAVGDSVTTDEIIGEIETDKTSIPIHSPCNGVIEELLVNDGDKVVAVQDILKIKEGAGGDSKPKEADKPKHEDPPVVEKKSEPPPPPKDEKVIREVTPPASLEIQKPTAQSPPPPSSKSMATSTASGKAGIEYIGGSRGEQRVKMNRMRLRIAQRLKDAQNTCAMLTTFNECDMSEIINLRKKYQEPFTKKHGVKLGFMSAFIKAAAVALQDQPVVNAVIDGGDIIYRDYIDISVAVATPKGLVVPVLRDVHRMGLGDIELGVATLGERAKTGQLAIEDMDGGTFTISNGGVFGSLLGTPIINPPQSAILGIHATQMRPVVLPDGSIAARPMMYLALTYDHRLVDGREAVTFLRKIKAFIEDPRLVLVQL